MICILGRNGLIFLNSLLNFLSSDIIKDCFEERTTPQSNGRLQALMDFGFDIGSFMMLETIFSKSHQGMFVDPLDA